jgi:hypothetical protein
MVGVMAVLRARLTGADNVRRVTLCPRDLHRLAP